jgi:hypothetical protein
MGRKILAVIAGLVVGGLVVGGMEAVGHAIYPLPAGLNPEDALALKAYIATLPVGAFLMVFLSHVLGSLAGSAVATLASGRSSLFPGVIVGALLLVGGIINAVMIPHPLWFVIVDLALYLPVAYLSVRLTLKQPL